MTTLKKYFLLLIFGSFCLASMPVHAQWATIARKIKSMHTSETDIATVILEAKTFRVYQTVIDTLTSDKKFEVISRDNAKRLVEFTRGKDKVSMQVDSLENGLTQITISAIHSDKSAKQTTDVAIEAIIRISGMVGIKCTVDKPTAVKK